MISFPDSILDAVARLQRLYDGTINHVIVTFPIIEIIRESFDKEVSLKLFFNMKSGFLEIQAPTYTYHSKISHYDYNKSERRWVRNKEYIFSIIRNLKKSGLWALVSNPDFIVVNSFNKNTDPKILLKALREIESL